MRYRICALICLTGMALLAFGCGDEKTDAHSGNTVNAVMATRDLPANTVLKSSDLAKIATSKERASKSVILYSDASSLPGSKTRFPVKKGQIMVWADVF